MSNPVTQIPQAQRTWTEEELQALPDDSYNYEVVGGALVMTPNGGIQHGEICVQIATALTIFVHAKKLGVVLDSSTGFWMQNRNCRAPDISFIAKARLKKWRRAPAAFFKGAPDLAVEVMAPSNTPGEISRRLDDFFASGTQLAWVIHPEDQFVEICHSPVQRKMLASGAILDGESLLPGFQYPIADLFQDWNWD